MTSREERLAKLSPEKRALYEARLAEKRGKAAPREAILPRGDAGDAPLSLAQQQIWLAEQLRGGCAYNLQVTYRVRGQLDVATLRRAFESLQARHEVLRTTFAVVDGRPVQRVQPPQPVELPLSDLADKSSERREEEALEVATAELSRPFDLEGGPLWRARLVRLGTEDYRLLFSVHHLIVDGWSYAIVMAELAELYAAMHGSREPKLPRLSIQYADYASWERPWLETEAAEAQLGYWRERFSDGITPLELSTKPLGEAGRSDRGARAAAIWSGGLPSALRQLSRDQGATLFMTLLAGFKALLHRYSGQTDTVVGTTFFHRNRPETGPMIGCFVNLLLLRTDLEGDPSFAEVLRRVRASALSAFEHASVPFDAVVAALDVQRESSGVVVPQVLFQLLPGWGHELPAGDIRLSLTESAANSLRWDLELTLVEGEHEIDCELLYDPTRFESGVVERMVEHLRVLLEAAADDPEQPIGSLPLMTEDERSRMQVACGADLTSPYEPTSVHELFDEQADRAAEVCAVWDGDRQLTYAELLRRANRLAHHLVELGVGRDATVGLCLERSGDAMVALLAILKAGGAYVPLDPELPRARLERMARDSGLRWLVTRESLLGLIDDDGLEVVCLDRDSAAIRARDATSPESETAPDDLAYVMFTSGSTGRPKGVAMTHRALANLVGWQVATSSCGAGARTAQLASLSFDVSFQEVFGTWCAGGTLVVAGDEQRRDPRALLRLLDEHEVERLFAPFVALEQLAESVAAGVPPPEQLREVITAGEQLRITPALRTLFGRLEGATLSNHYGPTEAHVVTAHTLSGPPSSWPDLPPIGRPIPGVLVRVVDAKLQPVPAGIAGELCLGGICLARGYQGRPELTAERFVADPTDPTGEMRLYRTGDRCRLRADGELEFLGRLDRQVKVRGHRVELGEIESVLGRHPDVAQCAVVTEGEGIRTRLVAHVRLRDPATADAELRHHLAAQLPEVMVPAHYVRVEALPLTPTGKVDRRALPAAEWRRRKDGRVTPNRPVERRLAEIWQELLGVDSVGLHDNFFDLGGHSLLAVQLSALIEQRLGPVLPLQVIFAEPTIYLMAEALQNRLELDPVIVLQGQGRAAPLFFVPGVGGHSFELQPLASHLGRDRVCYGLQFPGVDGRQRPHDQVRDLAAALAEVIRQKQPSGPYLLCGYSFGGLVAHELARQLDGAGEEVALLVLLAPTALHPLQRRWLPDAVPRLADKLLEYGGMAQRLDWPGLVAELKRRLVGKMRRAAGVEVRGATLSTIQRHVLEVNLRSREALRRFRPEPCDVPTVLVRTGGYPEQLWPRDYGRNVQIVDVPGDHQTLIEEPHVRAVAERLRPYLDRAAPVL